MAHGTDSKHVRILTLEHGVRRSDLDRIVRSSPGPTETYETALDRDVADRNSQQPPPENEMYILYLINPPMNPRFRPMGGVVQ